MKNKTSQNMFAANEEFISLFSIWYEKKKQLNLFIAVDTTVSCMSNYRLFQQEQKIFLFRLDKNIYWSQSNW